MGKVITCPVEKWPGTVTISDPLSLPQVSAIEKANAEADLLRVNKWICGKCKKIHEKPEQVNCEKCGAEIELWRTLPDGVSIAMYRTPLMPAYLDCVEMWNLEGLGNPPAVFPGTPRVSSSRLAGWLIDEVRLLFREAEEIPNE
jgi:hypothetical protein